MFFLWLLNGYEFPFHDAKIKYCFYTTKTYYYFISVIILILNFIIIWKNRKNFTGTQKKQGPRGTHPCRPLLRSYLQDSTVFSTFFYLLPRRYAAVARKCCLFFSFYRLLSTVVMVNDFALSVHQTDTYRILSHGKNRKSGFI